MTSGDDSVPVLDPALWSGALPWLLLVLAAQAVVAVMVLPPGRLVAWPVGRERRARPRVRAARCSCCCGRATCSTPAFVAVLVEGGWADAERDLTVATTLGVVVVLVWSVVETVRNVAARRPALSRGNVGENR